MPYRIKQCYLPRDRDDIPAFTLAEAGTRFSDHGGMQGWADLVGWLHTEMVCNYDFDFNDISFPSHYLPSRTVVLAIVFTV